MLKVRGKSIIASQGDTLSISIRVPDYAFESTDKIVFGVKQDLEGESILEKQYTNIVGDVVNINILPAEMALPIGEYYWDLSVTKANGTHYTLNFASLLKIVGVAHND